VLGLCHLRANDAPRKRGLHAASRPGQLGPVKAKFLADAAYNARVKDLARSAERDFRLPPLVMDYHHDWALASFLMPVVSRGATQALLFAKVSLREAPCVATAP
jgi:hypothetical protein